MLFYFSPLNKLSILRWPVNSLFPLGNGAKCCKQDLFASARFGCWLFLSSFSFSLIFSLSEADKVYTKIIIADPIHNFYTCAGKIKDIKIPGLTWTNPYCSNWSLYMLSYLYSINGFVWKKIKNYRSNSGFWGQKKKPFAACSRCSVC